MLELFHLNTPQSFSPEEEKDLIYYLDHEIEKFFVIEIDSGIVGCGGINFKEEGRVGVLSWAFIHPEMHGKGLGTSIVKHRVNYLLNETSVEKIIVRTSQLVFSFYEKNGFVLKEIKKDYWAKGYDLYDMEYDR